MGHYSREMDPEGATKQDKRICKERRLRRELENIPLSKFSVKDLEPLLKLFGLAAFIDTATPDTKDLVYLERKLQNIKGKKRGK